MGIGEALKAIIRGRAAGDDLRAALDKKGLSTAEKAATFLGCLGHELEQLGLVTIHRDEFRKLFGGLVK